MNENTNEIAKALTGGKSKAEFMAMWEERRGSLYEGKAQPVSEKHKKALVEYTEKLKGTKPHRIETDSVGVLIRTHDRIQRFLVEKQGREYKRHENAAKIAEVVKWGCGRESAIPYNMGVCLFGFTGSGKTLCFDALQKLLAGSKRAIVKVHSRGVWNAQKEGRPISALSSPKILFIDDLGDEPTYLKDFGNDVPVMANIIFDRDKMLKERAVYTIATTNLTPAEMEEKYGSRTFRRIRQMFYFVDLSDGMADGF